MFLKLLPFWILAFNPWFYLILNCSRSFFVFIITPFEFRVRKLFCTITTKTHIFKWLHFQSVSFEKRAHSHNKYLEKNEITKFIAFECVWAYRMRYPYWWGSIYIIFLFYIPGEKGRVGRVRIIRNQHWDSVSTGRAHSDDSSQTVDTIHIKCWLSASWEVSALSLGYGSSISVQKRQRTTKNICVVDRKFWRHILPFFLWFRENRLICCWCFFLFFVGYIKSQSMSVGEILCTYTRP